MTHQIRVLCLHGWRTNSTILKHQTIGLREAFGSNADFLYINAPWPASGPAPELVRVIFGEIGPFYQWWNAVKHKDDTTQFHYEGFEGSIDYLMDQLQTLGPIDVILGFSQGAAVATLLTAHYRVNYGHVPWKACILVGGFNPRNHETKELLDAAKTSVDGAIDIPSVHIIGRADPIALKSEELVESFTNVRRFKLEHEEGHKFPSPVTCKQLYSDVAQEVLVITRQAWKFECKLAAFGLRNEAMTMMKVVTFVKDKLQRYDAS